MAMNPKSVQNKHCHPIFHYIPTCMSQTVRNLCSLSMVLKNLIRENSILATGNNPILAVSQDHSREPPCNTLHDNLQSQNLYQKGTGTPWP